MAPPHDGFLWLLHVAEALRALAQTPANLDDVARRFGLTKNKLDLWSRRLAKLPQGLLLNGRRHGNGKNPASGQSSVPIDLPEGQARELARETWKVMYVLASGGGQSHLTAIAADLRLKRIVSKFPAMLVPGSQLSVVADGVSDARRWLWFVEMIGIADIVTVELSCSRGAGADAPDKQHGYWEDKLGRTVDLSAQRVAGRPRTTMTSDPEKLQKQRRRSGKNDVLYGRRFVLAMALITGAS